MKNMKDGFIGFLDSGVGGISVLNEAIKLMPKEKFVYLGDSKNAPYGTKTKKDVKELTEKNVDKLIEDGAKAIVIACNTATSAAATYLRDKYKEHGIPILGVEPALKPAALSHKGEKILVMATTMTLAEKKFEVLMHKYEKEAEIIPVPCPGLMDFVEAGILEGEELETFLKEILTEDICQGTTAVVLGCTHYPFVKRAIIKVIGHQVDVYDGGVGTAKHLQKQLEKLNLCCGDDSFGKLTIYNSSENEDMIKLSQSLAKTNYLKTDK